MRAPCKRKQFFQSRSFFDPRLSNAACRANSAFIRANRENPRAARNDFLRRDDPMEKSGFSFPWTRRGCTTNSHPMIPFPCRCSASSLFIVQTSHNEANRVFQNRDRLFGVRENAQAEQSTYPDKTVEPCRPHKASHPRFTLHPREPSPHKSTNISRHERAIFCIFFHTKNNCTISISWLHFQHTRNRSPASKIAAPLVHIFHFSVRQCRI